MESPRQAGRETGPHRSLLCPDSHIKTHQAQKNERPETKPTCCYSYKKHSNAAGDSSFSHSLFPQKQGGFQGQDITIPSSLPNAKDCFPQSVNVYFCGSVFSFEPQTVPLCTDLSGWKQSSGWALFLQWCSWLCGPVSQGLCLLGRSIVNLLLDTLSCRSVQLDNRPLAVFCFSAVCSDLWWIEA